jgi:metal-responsive CopG/Arc/MetJ family transcriptional regulator
MCALHKRAKFSATVDATLLEAVDRYVQDHDKMNRSMVIDDALRLWVARERERAIEAQFAAPQSAEERAERESWQAIRRAAAQRLFRQR